MKVKTASTLSNIFAALATLLTWLSGFFLMQVVYKSVVGAMLFASVIAIIVFCESRFSSISLKSDGKITINKEEVKSNLWQIVTAICTAFLVSIPLELRIFEKLFPVSEKLDLGDSLSALWMLFPYEWLIMIIVFLLVETVFLAPILIRMMSEEVNED